MSVFAPRSIIYEINTAVWLHELSAQLGQPITLANVPESVVAALAIPGVTTIWMMGIWERSAYSRQHALQYKHEYVSALPDMTDEDVIGSAYAVGAYEVAAAYGGRAALAQFRRQLQAHGLKLMLDYVPNHVGVDHEWVDRPGFIVHGRAEDAARRPSDFFRHKPRAGGRAVILAYGRDPYYPGWADTAQLNIFNPAVRAEVRRTLLDIASQCDGVRCDMAMLLLNDIFSATWNGYLRHAPGQEFWAEIIPAIKAEYPEFTFLAEVYWGKEGDLLALGFDSVYDKVFYDRLTAADVPRLRDHLRAPLEFQRRVTRFLENHDEPRAYKALGPQRSFAAATVLLTTPGHLLLHDGQFTGRLAKLPVQIRRAPVEPAMQALREHYTQLLAETLDPVYTHGELTMFTVDPISADPTYMALLAYGWHLPGDGYRLIVVNLGAQHAYGRVELAPWAGITGREWRLYDVLDGAEYARRGDEMSDSGLFVSLEAHEAHVFRFSPTGQ